MKETIYTIPVNEVYETDCECPLCELEKKLEAEAVEYSLGAAMMEPDFRLISNEKGYCSHHFKMMFDAPNKLPLALVLDTHLMEAIRKIDKLATLPDTVGKKGLFKKSNIKEVAKELSDGLNDIQRSCVTCEKINSTMERYIDVLLYMWANDESFRTKFDRSKGVCLKHFKMLCDAAPVSLKGENIRLFLSMLIKKEQKELARIQEDIHKFTLKFDYRNQDMPWGTAKDAPERTIEKLSGYMNNNIEFKK